MDPSLVDQILPFFNPTINYLTSEETVKALNKNLVAFPEVIRSLNDPQVDTDTYVLLSFLKSQNQESYVKVRGYGNLESCKEKAKQIVKSIDSRLPIAIARLGQWCYVTPDPKKVSKETIKLIDDKEVTHKEHVDTLLSEYEKNTKNEDEIKEVPQDLLGEDLISFIKEKVKMYESYKQIQFLNMKLSLLNERQSILLSINKQSSDKYEEIWFDEYLSQLAKVGIKTTNISIERLKEIENEIILINDVTNLKEKLRENESKYNSLRYSTVDF